MADLLVTGLLLAIGGALLMATWLTERRNFFDDVVAPMTSVYLLPSMGMLVALRRRAVDLSVWVVAGCGGLVTAALIRAGLAPLWSMAGGVLAGALLGLTNGLLTVISRLPAPLVTFITALTAMWACQALYPQRAGEVASTTWQGWYISMESVVRPASDTVTDQPDAPSQAVEEQAAGTERLSLPLTITRMFLAACAYSAALLTMVGTGRLKRVKAWISPAGSLVVALCASGALAAAGGVLWLLEHSIAPVPSRPIGDLRVLAAPLMAGALLLRGPGRSLLAAVYLPPALLVATVWRQEGWYLLLRGYAVHVLLLAAVVLVSQKALARGLVSAGLARCLASIGGGSCIAGLLIWCISSASMPENYRSLLHYAGLVLIVAGALVVLAERVISLKRAHTP